jgi:hypothetical protein
VFRRAAGSWTVDHLECLLFVENQYQGTAGGSNLMVAKGT